MVAQSDIDGRRFEELGAKRVSVSGNLKVDTGMPPYDGEDLAKLKQQIGDRPVWIAVSTHRGEEELVADSQLNEAGEDIEIENSGDSAELITESEYEQDSGYVSWAHKKEYKGEKISVDFYETDIKNVCTADDEDFLFILTSVQGILD